MLEMNSPLEHDFVDGYGFTSNSDIPEDKANPALQIRDTQIDIAKALECAPEELPQCEICTQKFLSKKELRSHITIHLGQPRIILKRCNSLHKNRKKDKDIYSLNQGQRGSLKLTLKKQNRSDFTVINKDSEVKTEFQEAEEVAERDEQMAEEETEEESTSDRDDNVMLGEGNDDNDDYKSSDDNDRPSVEVNEGDSGVGSDMANPSEKEDQNVDDLAVEQEDTEEQEDKIEENEDPEESDALEATFRETIENLKKLGEQSRSVRDDMSPRDPNSSSVSPPAAEESTSNDAASAPVQEKEPPTFGWISAKSFEGLSKPPDEPPLEPVDPIASDSATSLLQNFLLEHHRKNQTSNEVINLPVETEYVSLERLAETVNTCRVCNEKFRDITLLDEHRAQAGHYQCNIPDCLSAVFKTRTDLTTHKVQAHGAPLSPSISMTHITRSSPQLSEGSPHMGQNSPHLSNHSPHLSNHSPHGMSIEPSQLSRTSPHGHSPTAGPGGMIPPVNFEQLPAPVQQLAQQVQRMPLPHPQMPSLPPNVNTMIPGPNYYMQPPGRPPPPMYRGPGPQGMQYSPHVAAYLQSQYAGAYQQYQTSQMHPQMQQQVPRVRYQPMMPNPRGPRMPPNPAPPRQRMKRPGPPPQGQPMGQQSINKQRRMDVLLPDRNEDADCHVIVQQKRNDGLPIIQNVQGATTQPSSGRNDSTIHLTDSITLSVRQPGSTPAQPASSPTTTTTKKPDAKAVANVLAARGITVTPAANKNKGIDQQKQAQQAPQAAGPRAPAPPPPAVSALNLNSAISIIPAQRKQQPQQQEQSGQFAVPQNKQSKPSNQEVERPPRPPTVDLTQDTPEAARNSRRGRPPRSPLTCQICDKTFPSQEMVVQHMAVHRGTNKLLHKCNLCTAQYPNAQALAVHKQTYHKDMEHPSANGNTELAIPVVDLKSPQAMNRLQSLGIHSYIPLSQLSAQTGGYFGLPIITIDGARNKNSCNLGALGATSILSLGPLKHLSNR